MATPKACKSVRNTFLYESMNKSGYTDKIIKLAISKGVKLLPKDLNFEIATINKYYKFPLKKEVLDAFVDVGTSRMFMTEDEETIYVKSVDKDGKAILHPYQHGEDEDITTSTDYVTKDDLKSMLSDAVGEFSKLIPSTDNLVRKDEIRDIIVETLSSNRNRKKEEE